MRMKRSCKLVQVAVPDTVHFAARLSFGDGAPLLGSSQGLAGTKLLLSLLLSILLAFREVSSAKSLKLCCNSSSATFDFKESIWCLNGEWSKESKGKKDKVTEEPNACEVCVEVIGQLRTQLGDDAKKQPKIEKGITKYCKNKKLNTKQKKMCYYFEPIKKLVARPISIGMPPLKVCQKLKKNNPEICEVKYPAKLDLDKLDFKKMRVKQLKSILADEGVDYKGLTEKEDFVKKVKKIAKSRSKKEL